MLGPSKYGPKTYEKVSGAELQKEFERVNRANWWIQAMAITLCFAFFASTVTLSILLATKKPETALGTAEPEEKIVYRNPPLPTTSSEGLTLFSQTMDTLAEQDLADLTDSQKSAFSELVKKTRGTFLQNMLFGNPTLIPTWVTMTEDSNNQPSHCKPFDGTSGILMEAVTKQPACFSNSPPSDWSKLNIRSEYDNLKEGAAYVQKTADGNGYRYESIFNPTTNGQSGKPEGYLNKVELVCKTEGTKDWGGGAVRQTADSYRVHVPCEDPSEFCCISDPCAAVGGVCVTPTSPAAPETFISTVSFLCYGTDTFTDGICHIPGCEAHGGKCVAEGQCDAATPAIVDSYVSYPINQLFQCGENKVCCLNNPCESQLRGACITAADAIKTPLDPKTNLMTVRRPGLCNSKTNPNGYKEGMLCQGPMHAVELRSGVQNRYWF